MIQHKHDVGVLPASDETDFPNDDDDVGLKRFLDRFDLRKE